MEKALFHNFQNKPNLFRENRVIFMDKSPENKEKLEAQAEAETDKILDAVKHPENLLNDIGHLSWENIQKPKNPGTAKTFIEAFLDIEVFRKGAIAKLDGKSPETLSGPAYSDIQGKIVQYLGINFSKGFMEKMPEDILKKITEGKIQKMNFDFDGKKVTCTVINTDGSTDKQFTFSMDTEGLKTFKVEREKIKSETYAKLANEAETKVAEAEKPSPVVATDSADSPLDKKENSKTSAAPIYPDSTGPKPSKGTKAATKIKYKNKALKVEKDSKPITSEEAGLDKPTVKPTPKVIPAPILTPAKAPSTLAPEPKTETPPTKLTAETGTSDVPTTISAPTPSTPLEKSAELTDSKVKELFLKSLENLNKEVEIDGEIASWVSNDRTWKENQKQIDGLASVNFILSQPPFKVSNDSDNVMHLVKMLEKGQNFKISSRDVFEHFKLWNGIAYGDFQTMVEKHQKDPSTNKDLLAADTETLNAIGTLLKALEKLKHKKLEAGGAGTSIEPPKEIKDAITDIFGQDEGSKKWYPWTAWLGKKIAGEDTSTTELSMEDVGFNEKTREEQDRLRRYMAEDAATRELIYKIYKENPETEELEFNTDTLKEELKSRMNIGLDLCYGATKDTKLKSIRHDINKKYGSKDAAKTAIANKIANLEKLDEAEKEIIRAGHVEARIFNQFKEEIVYSDNEEIAAIQKAVKKENPDMTEKDLWEVERILLGGIGANLNFENGKLIGVTPDLLIPIKLPDGWTVSASTAGVGLTKSIALSKNGRTMLILGAQGWITHGGVHAGIQFPVGEKLNMLVGGTAGSMGGVLYYVGGGIGFDRYQEGADYSKRQEAIQEANFDKAMALVNKQAETSEIIKAIYEIPEYGVYLKQLQSKYKITDEGIVAIFKRDSNRIQSEAITGNKDKFHPDIRIKGGGVYGYIANGIPGVGGYLTLNLGSRPVTVRRHIPGESAGADKNQEEFEKMLAATDTKKLDLSDEEYMDMITKLESMGKNAVLTLDENGDIAIAREQKTDFDITKYLQSPESLNQGLKKTINCNILEDSSGGVQLVINSIGGSTNSKVYVDPEIKEYLSVNDGKILLSLSSGQNLIFTREDTFYPFKKQGQYMESVITIKADPKRSRTSIARESTHFIQQFAGYRPDIYRGIKKAVSGTPERVIPFEEFKDILSKTAPSASKAEIQKAYSDYDANMRDYLNETDIAKVKEAPQANIVPTEMKGESFAESLYLKLQKNNEYKRLSTINKDTSIEQYRANMKTLIEKMRSEASTQKIELSIADQNAVLLYLTARSFAEADPAKKAEIMKQRLEFARKQVFIPEFNTAIANLKARGITISASAESLVEKMIAHLKTTDFNGADSGIPSGSKFLSAVGTQGEIGLREILHYDNDPYYKMLNYEKVDPSGELGKVLLEITSPLRKDNAGVMKSELAMKLAANKEAIFLLFGPEKGKALAESLKSKTVGNAETFNKFKALVLAIRAAETGSDEYMVSSPDGKTKFFVINKMPQFKGLGDIFAVEMKNEVGAGIYEKCTNGTILGYEDIKVLYKPGEKGGVKVAQYENVDAQSNEALYEIIIGLRANFMKTEKPTEKPDKPTPRKPHDRGPGSNKPHTDGTPPEAGDTGGTTTPPEA